MHVRASLAALVILASSPAWADTFGGFSGVDRPYLVNQDKVCTPLPVADGKASGMPACDKQGADAIAALAVKPPVEQKGPKADFVATAAGTTITISRKDAELPAVTWEAPDPVVKIAGLYASQYEDRVAVAYTVRRLGRETTDVVAFELVKTTGRTGTGSGSISATGTGTGSATGTTGPVVEDAKVKAAVDAARRTGRAGAMAAWKKVLALDPQHAEALYRVAAAQLAGKDRAGALATLGQLAKSSRPDAIEWLVEARFAPEFAPVRADPTFRTAVGLDRQPHTTYERVMGFGGQWEQTGTSCEEARVDLQFARDRTFKVRVSSACEGNAFDITKHGVWRLDGDRLVLALPTRGQAVSPKDEAPCDFTQVGGEDALHCSLGHDLEFTVLPARR